MKLNTRTSLLFLLIALSLGLKTNLNSKRKNECPKTEYELYEKAKILFEPLVRNFKFLINQKRMMSSFEISFLDACSKLHRSGLHRSQKIIQTSILKEFTTKINSRIPIFEKAKRILESSKKYLPYKALARRCHLRHLITDNLVKYIARKLREKLPARTLMQFFWKGYVSEYPDYYFCQAASEAKQYLKSGRTFYDSDEYKKMALGWNGAICYKRSVIKLKNYVRTLLKTGSLEAILNRPDHDGWPIRILRKPKTIHSCVQKFYKG